GRGRGAGQGNVPSPRPRPRPGPGRGRGGRARERRRRVENVEIARVLRDVADLLEMRGENPFKVRAYRNAARTVEGLPRRLAEMVGTSEYMEGLLAVRKDTV